MAVSRTRPEPRPEVDRSFRNDLGMTMAGIANIGKGREAATQAMMDKGYSPTQISDFRARSANTQSAFDSGRDREDSSQQRITPQAPVEDEAVLGPRPNNPAMQYRQMLMQRFGGAPMQQQPTQMPTMPGGKGAPTAMTVMQPPEITPEMRRAALGIYESQRGAGVVPYQMRPYMGEAQENVNPAFQYAAQNYARLGGDQRLADRPMEMMSVAERQQINNMAQGMANAQPMQRLTGFPGKGSVGQTPEVVNRLAPITARMGIASLRGMGFPGSTV